MNSNIATGSAVTLGTKTVHTVRESFPGSGSFYTGCSKNLANAVATPAAVTCKTCLKGM